ncbi:Protein of unknown function (DUF3445) [Teratosphaeria destructans]|uniref:Uncharacterized protein n=1 Tax=Teratosphaeria destructans TaxID=418781 RepID=A0A9W7W0E9_9PEZI|nr:Protein of unknown function (DUF3445) [Teratosphaeria destructans]
MFFWAILAALLAGLAVLVWRAAQTWRRESLLLSDSGSVTREKDVYSDIEPLNEFEWRRTPPAQLWAFKPKYHLTMGLETLPLSDLVAVDRTYYERVKIRREIMDQHPAETKQCNKPAEAAVLELYSWMVTTYLPRRFPTMYSIKTNDQTPRLLNLVTQKHLPLHPASPMAALDILGENVDTDFLVLLPSSTSPDGSPIYHLEAFITCFPTGFSPREKCGKPLASIHGPVPGYHSKLEKSMDRFFAKLECGRAVKRSNWSVTTNDLLYAETGNHLYSNDDQGTTMGNAKTLDLESPNLQADIERQKQEVVIEDCRLRCERQTLHRLEKTKALVFAFKTYQYKLSEVKEAGVGPELAAAIDGLAGGNVPAMAFYKRGVVWGDKVKEYLMS